MANILISAILAIIITFLVSYNIQFLNTPEQHQNLGYLSHLSNHSGGIIGLLVGSFMGLFFAVTPTLLRIPALIKEKLTQVRLSSDPIQTYGQVTHVHDSGDSTKLTLAYGDHTKDFVLNNALLNEAIKVGQKIAVFYNPENKNESYLDLFYDASLSSKPSKEEISQSSTVFKLLEITPDLSKGTNIYEISGEIFGDTYDGQKAKFSHPFESNDLSSLIPGRLIPCKIEKSGNDFSISLVLN